MELPATAARLGSAGNCNLQRRIPDGRDNEPTNRGPNLAPLGRNYSQRPLRGAMCLLLYPFTENVGRRDLRLIPAKVSSSSAEPGYQCVDSISMHSAPAALGLPVLSDFLDQPLSSIGCPVLACFSVASLCPFIQWRISAFSRQNDPLFCRSAPR